MYLCQDSRLPTFADKSAGLKDLTNQKSASKDMGVENARLGTIPSATTTNQHVVRYQGVRSRSGDSG
jgi:hypothetical protein